MQNYYCTIELFFFPCKDLIVIYLFVCLFLEQFYYNLFICEPAPPPALWVYFSVNTLKCSAVVTP